MRLIFNTTDHQTARLIYRKYQARGHQVRIVFLPASKRYRVIAVKRTFRDTVFPFLCGLLPWVTVYFIIKFH